MSDHELAIALNIIYDRQYRARRNVRRLLDNPF